MPAISPILAKELWPQLRSPRTTRSVMTLVVILGAAYSIMWAASFRGAMGIHGRAALGRSMFVMCSLVQLGVLGLLAPILAAGTVTSEREQGTMDLLQASPLRPWTILWHKWWAVIALLGLSVVMTAPVQTLIFQLGGVGQDEFFWMSALIAATAVAYGMLGIGISSRMNRTSKATLAAIGAVLGICFGVPLILMLLADSNWAFGVQERDMLAAIRVISPPVLAIEILGSGGVFGFGPLFANLVFSAFVFLFGTWLAHGGLKRREGKRSDVGRRTPARKARAPQVRSPLPDGSDPVYLREMRSGVSYPRLLLGAAAGISLLFAYIFRRDEPNWVPQTYAFLTATAAAFIIPAFAATMLTREREQKTLGLLLTTPLSAREIVLGKCKAGAAFIALVAPALMLPGVVCLAIVKSSYPLPFFWKSVALACGMAPFFLLFAATTLYASSRARTSGEATAQSIALCVLLCLGPYLAQLICYLAAEVLRIRIYGDRYGAFQPLIDLIQFLGPAVSPFYYLAPIEGKGVWGEPLDFPLASATAYGTATTTLAYCILKRAAGIFLRKGAE